MGRRSLVKSPPSDVARHGGSWKRMCVELFLRDRYSDSNDSCDSSESIESIDSNDSIDSSDNIDNSDSESSDSKDNRQQSNSIVKADWGQRTTSSFRGTATF